MNNVMGDKWLEHQRISYVWIRDKWVAYPFQNNINKLPETDIVNCVMGLVDAQKTVHTAPPSNFEEWIMRSFGKGIADIFMMPYNFKVWATEPKNMACQWMGERVPTLDLRKVISNVVTGVEDAGWGPNATFRFPLHGGTGGIWLNLAKHHLDESKVKLNAEVEAVDATDKKITLSTGEVISYDYLISTAPVDILCQRIKSHPQLKDMAAPLVHSSSHIIGIGVKGVRPDDIGPKCWLYFPGDNCNFYRATIFSNYSPNHVPAGEPYWSIMCEVSESKEKPVNHATVVEDCIQGLINVKMLKDRSFVASTWHKFLEYGYPTPSINRDQILNKVLPVLKDLGIYSRGRFGGWKYEVGNQDHSFMQGVEAVHNILYGHEEITYFDPNRVNNPANKAKNCENYEKK